jgi:hypothetical protein
MPEARMPAPTSRSLPYICAVSRCPVAELQSRLDHSDAQILFQGHGAKTEDWNSRTVTFNDFHN